MKLIYDYTQDQMIEEFLELGEKKFRATQVFEWLYRQNVQSFEQMNNLSLSLREKLSLNLSYRTFKDRRKNRFHRMELLNIFCNYLMVVLLKQY